MPTSGVTNAIIAIELEPTAAQIGGSASGYHGDSLSR
jgi:hypothetical protein